jgi:hypothetical protein
VESKELRIARYEATLWEFCYKLQTGEWSLDFFDPKVIQRLRALVQSPLWLKE